VRTLWQDQQAEDIGPKTMSVYKVATTSLGARVWWPHWQLPYGLPNCRDIRDATDEEATLMEKVVWDRDTPLDLEKLRDMIAQS
jgi:hypothetical protein